MSIHDLHQLNINGWRSSQPPVALELVVIDVYIKNAKRGSSDNDGVISVLKVHSVS